MPPNSEPSLIIIHRQHNKHLRDTETDTTYTLISTTQFRRFGSVVGTQQNTFTVLILALCIGGGRCLCVCLCVKIFVCIHSFVGSDRHLCDIGYNNSPLWRGTGLFLEAALTHDTYQKEHGWSSVTEQPRILSLRHIERATVAWMQVLTKGCSEVWFLVSVANQLQSCLKCDILYVLLLIMIKKT